MVSKGVCYHRAKDFELVRVSNGSNSSFYVLFAHYRGHPSYGTKDVVVGRVEECDFCVENRFFRQDCDEFPYFSRYTELTENDASIVRNYFSEHLGIDDVKVR